MKKVVRQSRQVPWFTPMLTPLNKFTPSSSEHLILRSSRRDELGDIMMIKKGYVGYTTNVLRHGPWLLIEKCFQCSGLQ
jgi:hypothetical protein